MSTLTPHFLYVPSALSRFLDGLSLFWTGAFSLFCAHVCRGLEMSPTDAVTWLLAAEYVRVFLCVKKRFVLSGRFYRSVELA